MSIHDLAHFLPNVWDRFDVSDTQHPAAVVFVKDYKVIGSTIVTSVQHDARDGVYQLGLEITGGTAKCEHQLTVLHHQKRLVVVGLASLPLPLNASCVLMCFRGSLIGAEVGTWTKPYQRDGVTVYGRVSDLYTHVLAWIQRLFDADEIIESDVPELCVS